MYFLVTINAFVILISSHISLPTPVTAENGSHVDEKVFTQNDRNYKFMEHSVHARALTHGPEVAQSA